MTMNSAPARNIDQDAWIAADNFELIAGLQGLDSVLSPDHRHGAQQATSIKFKMVFRHARSSGLHRLAVV